MISDKVVLTSLFVAVGIAGGWCVMSGGGYEAIMLGVWLGVTATCWMVNLWGWLDD